MEVVTLLPAELLQVQQFFCGLAHRLTPRKIPPGHSFWPCPGGSRLTEREHRQHGEESAGRRRTPASGRRGWQGASLRRLMPRRGAGDRLDGARSLRDRSADLGYRHQIDRLARLLRGWRRGQIALARLALARMIERRRAAELG